MFFLKKYETHCREMMENKLNFKIKIKIKIYILKWALEFRIYSPITLCMM